MTSTVETFWTEYTVGGDKFATAGEHLDYLDTRCDRYPGMRSLLDLWGDHEGVLLDYGCGPGHDTIGFAVHNPGVRVVAADVSATARAITSRYAQLHDVAERVTVLRVEDEPASVPLDDESVDYVHSCGVIHHAVDPAGTLAELHRVMKRGCRGRLMVYNRESHFFRVVCGDDDERFRHAADSGAPIVIAWPPREFQGLCDDAGFDTEFLGSYLMNEPDNEGVVGLGAVFEISKPGRGSR